MDRVVPWATLLALIAPHCADWHPYPLESMLRIQFMQQCYETKKGNQWYDGMKAHIGVDRDSGLVHTVVSTAANVADVT